MKKFINDPNDVLPEMMEGYLRAYGDIIERIEDYPSVVLKDLDPGKVGLIVGGGSGHEPIFIEYLGKGMADGASQGNICAAPSPDNILAVTKAVDRGKGVVYIYGNYSGDCMNFDMAAELADLEGIKTATVRVTDDVASAPKDRISDRRGIAGDFFVMRIAGAACYAGYDLEDVKRVADKANANTRTMGVALTPGTIPGEKPAFTLGEDEMEIGMGLHGEPGIRRDKIQPADKIVDQMMKMILEDLPFKKGDDVCLLVDGFGATTRMEMMIIIRRVSQLLDKEGITLHDVKFGNFATFQEMAGSSITLMRLDDELKKLYDSPMWSILFGQKGFSTHK
ncbi:dihydroxyacetone kinase subunit DhaK [Leptolinea tardivitalis]|uniref:Dihydroxyacetone kinase n=1 Tax=Leptolinea tardivitalis TaxID=229920 RepID=A0A0P6WP34_9CHLR|nr:dihydroxyacetone kinase subunit DhaK [Leptolinea tardivitalis]KPL70533.1 dihydroxyacetone kinase [Leptolinea tardivitalis]GAP22132.1 dihydroxyacetone kinase DhaK subunit [Leptolinea tardivitalis]